MQIILLEKVVNLGQLGDVVKVRDGYARNYLIPQGKARRATQAAVAEFEARRAELERIQAEKLAAAQAEGEKLAGRQFSLTEKSGVDGSAPSPTPTSPTPCTRPALPRCRSPWSGFPKVTSRPSANTRFRWPCTPTCWSTSPST